MVVAEAPLPLHTQNEFDEQRVPVTRVGSFAPHTGPGAVQTPEVAVLFEL